VTLKRAGRTPTSSKTLETFFATKRLELEPGEVRAIGSTADTPCGCPTAVWMSVPVVPLAASSDRRRCLVCGCAWAAERVSRIGELGDGVVPGSVNFCTEHHKQGATE
jgi:hypothetical protein